MLVVLKIALKKMLHLVKLDMEFKHMEYASDVELNGIVKLVSLLKNVMRVNQDHG